MHPKARGIRLFRLVIRVHREPPANGTLSDAMLMVILRGELPPFFSNDFPPAPAAPVNARMGWFGSWAVFSVESFVVALLDKLTVLVKCHNGPL
jgi:hypothetical protein